MIGMAMGMLGAFAFVLAVFLRAFGAAAEAWWKMRTGRIRLHHLWKDDRPIPASPGRRMLRVFGRLAKHAGLFGIIAVACASFFGRFSEPLAIVAVASIGMLFLGYGTDFTDSFLAGLYVEDDEPEIDDLISPHEVAPESDVDHDR